MRSPGRLPWMLLAALPAMPALAQTQDAEERARIEDFAIPQSEQAPRIEQLSDGSSGLPLPSQAPDRTLARPPASENAGAMPAQLSDGSQSGPPAQLSDAADSRTPQPNEVSSTSDSNPGAVVRLRGHDRCDPQLVQRVYAECLRILELRADEFNAPAPPQLSAEQKLLAEQRARDEELSRTSATSRLRFATMDEPDADLRSNQELASIFLATPPPAPPRQPEEPKGEDTADLGEILQGLGMPPGGAPPK